MLTLIWGGGFETESQIAQVSLKLTIIVQDVLEVLIILSLYPKFWGYRHDYYT